MKFNIGKDILPHEYKGSVYHQDSAKRLRVINKIFFILFVVFVARTLQLGLQQSEYKKNASGANEIARRADIIDRNGVVLAKSVRSGNIKLSPGKVKPKDYDAVANIIHDLAPMEYSVMDALKLFRSGKSWVYLKKNATEDQIRTIKEAHRKYNCFGFENFASRRYPQKNVFSHVIGFTGKNGAGGLEGLERVYDDYLKENKDPLRLSIDSRVQNIFHEQLNIAMEKFNAKGALGMLMKSNTGEIIAMVQLPDYDPNKYGSASQKILKSKLLHENFEMGSVFKIFNTAMAYENGLENNIYDVSKPFPIKDKHNRVVHRIKDVQSFYDKVVKKSGKTRMKAPEIMLHSCNTGSAQIALDLPDGTQKEFFQRLNFDKPLKLDFGKTNSGLVHKVWKPIDKAIASFGHGVTVTPMHLLLAVNAMTNGGFYLYPTLLKRDVGSVRAERVLDSEISSKLRNIMFNISEQSSGKGARVKGIEIGGKTGTAERRHTDGTTDTSRNTTVYAGVFPVAAPQYVILIMLEEPQGIKETGGFRTSSVNSVPTAGAILDKIMPLLFE